ncbi:MAG TPA: gluconate 2-dehydrogenase subunit 3 family protein [Chthoniobacteraceae bacterium]|jgi:hypothetical protein|nr:gluconate 2-dehydrogenase subunit 3 family protein [Chthoniobacteraceae bacterium]
MTITPTPLTRREAVQRMFAAAAALALIDATTYGAPYTGDPNLHTKAVTWDRILTKDELKMVTVLCDTIIPADDKSPAASAVGIPDFIDEWVSAPYPTQVADRDKLRAGLAWLDEEATKRFQKKFADLDEGQIKAICDDICHAPKAKPEFKKAASFFSKFRDLTAGGFYSTPEGWKDLGYVGNVPLAEFPGPPPEVLKHLGLA